MRLWLLQMRIFLVEDPEFKKPSTWSTSHKVFMAKCDFNFWNKIREFFFFLSQDKQEDMKTILEGIDPAKHQVRVAFDACKLLLKSRCYRKQELWISELQPRSSRTLLGDKGNPLHWKTLWSSNKKRFILLVVCFLSILFKWYS